MKIIDIIIILLLVAAITLLIIDIKRNMKETSKCLLNPLTYGVKIWGEENWDKLSCICKFDKPNTPTLFINENNITIKNGRI